MPSVFARELPSLGRLTLPAVKRTFHRPDLDSHFSTPSLARAKWEFERHRFGQARKLLQQEEQSHPVRFLSALAAFRAGELEVAAGELATLADEYVAMRDRCRLYAGEAFERLGKMDEAERALRSIPVTSRLYANARLHLLRVLLHKGDLAEATEIAEPLLTRMAETDLEYEEQAQVLLAAADLAKRKKDRAAERRWLSELWARYPWSAHSKLAKDRLGGALPLSAQVTRAEVLIEQNLNREGLAMLARIQRQKLPAELACRARFAHGKAMRKERKHAVAAKLLGEVVDGCEDGALVADALYVRGYSQSVIEPRAAVETYERLARSFPDHTTADDALFFAANLRRKLGDAEAAVAIYQQIGEQYWAGDFAAEALFQVFFMRRAAGQLESALAALDLTDELAGISASDEQVDRAHYWRGRALTELGRAAEAAGVYEGLVIDRSTTYYGLLARSQLERLDRRRAVQLARSVTALDRPSRGIWPIHAGPLATDPAFLAGLELARLGLPGADDELLSIERRGQPKDSIRLLFQILTAAGKRGAARRVLSGAERLELAGPISPDSIDVWQTTYPFHFRPLIERFCRKSRVDADLLQALIREESRFNPRALSSTGALGLTQLMPATAREVAKSLRLSEVSTTSLLDPERNVQLGAAYLGQLLRQFNGNRAYAVASYNAGPEAVRKWIDRVGKAELDEWVEQIPVQETRDYVKRVLGSYSAYQLLGQANASGLVAAAAQR